MKIKLASLSLIAPLIALLCGNILSSQSISKKDYLLTNLNSKDSIWVESSINDEIRKHGGVGFFYPYNLPDAHQKALALFRTYSTSINSGFAIINLCDSIRKPKKLLGRVKFSGSDIGNTKDTLIIAAHYSKTKSSALVTNLNSCIIPANADVKKISQPLAQFVPFSLKLSETINDEEKKYLIIQFIIKSGSDDSFYYGISNAVVDNLHFISH